MKFKNQNNKGFSIIETIITIFIFGLIGVLLFSFGRDIFYLNSNTFEKLKIQNDVTLAFKHMTKEIRNATTSSIGGYAIGKAGENTLTIYSDIDEDSLKERIRYFVSNNTLKKGVIKPTGNPLSYTGQEKIHILIENINNGGTPIFTYFDKNYNGSGSPLSSPISIEDIRLIKINVFVDKDPNRPPNSSNYTTQISIRSIKDNL